jgi:hypothetical protein
VTTTVLKVASVRDDMASVRDDVRAGRRPVLAVLVLAARVGLLASPELGRPESAARNVTAAQSRGRGGLFSR